MFKRLALGNIAVGGSAFLASFLTLSYEILRLDFLEILGRFSENEVHLSLNGENEFLTKFWFSEYESTCFSVQHNNRRAKQSFVSIAAI